MPKYPSLRPFESLPFWVEDACILDAQNRNAVTRYALLPKSFCEAIFIIIIYLIYYRYYYHYYCHNQAANTNTIRSLSLISFRQSILEFCSIRIKIVYNNKQYQSFRPKMITKQTLNRKLFDIKQHQNFLMSERELHIKQFETILSYKPVETIKYEDGSYYKGEVTQDGARNGIGMLIAGDGSIYMGKWKDGLYHQEGIYLYPDGERYEGQIYEGYKSGIGKMFYLNGDIYEGEWVEDCREGNGEISYANGDRYVGQWRQNKPYGEGTFYTGVKLVAQGKWDDKNFISGRVTTPQYQGQWQFGGPHGKGFYRYQDGSIYDGQWKNGQKNGTGTYQYSNGDLYMGTFRCGLKHGKGSYKYSTGDNYQGQFHNDLKHGFGVMKFITGDEYRGEWQHDLFHGPGTYTFSSKQVLKCKFAHGKPTDVESPFGKSAVNNGSNWNNGGPSSQKQPYVYSPMRIQKQYSKVNARSNISYKNGGSMLNNPSFKYSSSQRNIA